MLRPATPLAILLAGAFVLLLISVISAPIVKSIYLGQANGAVFGVFGYCPEKGDCSSVGIGYDNDEILGKDSSFQLSQSVRKTLSAILILHPVAAFITLVMFALAAASHAHAASHSARFLLVLIIFILIDFLITIAAFIIDILLFIPNQAFGTYLVLAAAIMILIGGVVSFFMRRTIVSRKARKNRIAENAEMSGENYYNREGQNKPLTSFSTQPTMPTFSGANGGAHDNLPTFASFESRPKDDQVSDERIPLTQRRTAERSPVANQADLANGGLAGPQRSQSRDRYGNPVNPGDAYSTHSRPSYERMNRPPGRGDMGPQRGHRGGGRGGFGRGGFDAYGAPMRGRGGYGPGPGRGGMGPRGRGGYPRGGYPPGMVPGMGRGGRSPNQAYGGMPNPHQRRPSAESYDAYGAQPGQGEYGWGGSNNPSMSNVNAYENDLPRAESPPPLPASGSETRGSEVMEMDATPVDHHQQPFDHYDGNQIRDSDTDVAGMVSLQQKHEADQRRDRYMSDGSKYSTDEQYAPPRAGWHNGSGRNSPRGMSPLHTGGSPAMDRGPSSPLAAPPSNSGNYYEDVDPRFEPQEQPQGYLAPPPIEPMYEDVHAGADGARSPAESERSNFTSVSQRGVNPRWNPQSQHPPMPPQGMGARRVVQQRQDMLLDNPDFQLSGGRSGKPKHGTQGMVPGSAYPTAPM